MYYLLVSYDDKGQFKSVVVTNDESKMKEWDGDVFTVPNLLLDLNL